MIVKKSKKKERKELLAVDYHNDISCILAHLRFKDKQEQEFIISEVMQAVGIELSTEYQISLDR